MAGFKLRKQYRLPKYNYANAGYYFVTICTKDRLHLFGEINNGAMVLSSLGKITHEYWLQIPIHAPYAKCDTFIVMPNHVHGIILIEHSAEEILNDDKILRPQKHSLSMVVRNFKSAVTTHVRKFSSGINVWQSRFYDRIVRNERELIAIRKYIEDNPLQWEVDKNKEENLLM